LSISSYESNINNFMVHSMNVHNLSTSSGKFHIMDGHAAIKIPCNENSEPLLDVVLANIGYNFIY
jgi:hypothetical protein